MSGGFQDAPHLAGHCCTMHSISSLLRSTCICHLSCCSHWTQTQLLNVSSVHPALFAGTHTSTMSLYIGDIIGVLPCLANQPIPQMAWFLVLRLRCPPDSCMCMELKKVQYSRSDIQAPGYSALGYSACESMHCKVTFPVWVFQLNFNSTAE